MTTKYYALLTNLGAAKLANAAALGTKLQITQMAVGDGGGVLPTPNASQTALIGEKRRAALNSLNVDTANSSQIIAEQVIPESEGGFWIREIGLFDADGVMIAVANCAETYKPQLQEGSGRTQTVRMIIIVSSTDAVTLKIDPAVVLATRKYVDDGIITVKAYADNLLTAHVKSSDPHTQYAPKASPTLTGTPKAPTPAATKNDTQIATTAFGQALMQAHASDADPHTQYLQKTQLSSATGSTSEDQAATPKAVKAANDNANGRVPQERQVNGKELSADISITAQDIFSGQTVLIGGGANLNTYQTPGLYYQPANAQAASGANYPEAVAGSLEVYKHAGITQVYRVYNNSRSYSRSLYGGSWSGWMMQYDEANKPSASDVGALPSGGTAVAANRLATARTINGVAFDGTSNITISASGIGSYTKAESDARYQQDTRLGARNYRSWGANAMYEIAGNVITGLQSDGGIDGTNDFIVMRPLQKLVNGTWYTVAQA